MQRTMDAPTKQSRGKRDFRKKDRTGANRRGNDGSSTNGNNNMLLQLP
jgi:hypothetical protein